MANEINDECSQSSKQNQTIKLLVAPEDVAAANALIDELGSLNINALIVAPSDISLKSDDIQESDILTVVVILSDALIQSFGGKSIAEEHLNSYGIQLIPVTPTNKAYPDLLGDRSQLPLLSFGMKRAARRIALVSKIGVSDIRDWNRLSAKAKRWLVDNRTESEYLNKGDLDRARELFRRPIIDLPEIEPKPLQYLVEATEKHMKKIARRRLIVFLSVLLLLIVSSIVAVVFKIQADGAAKVAQETADAAESDRLATQAISLIDTDPDLPWLLAERAYTISERPLSTAAMRMVTDNITPHQSISLRAAPVSVAMLADKRIVVGFYGGYGFDVVDSQQKTSVFSEASLTTGGTTMVSANSSGTSFFSFNLSSRLMIVYEVDGSSNNTNVERVISSEEQFDTMPNWYDDGNALTIINGQLGSLSMNTGLIVPVEFPGEIYSGDKLLSATYIKEENLLIVANSTSVEFWMCKTGADGNLSITDTEPSYSFEFDRATFMMYSPKISTLLLNNGSRQCVFDITDIVSKTAEPYVVQFELNATSFMTDASGRFCAGRENGTVAVINIDREAGSASPLPVEAELAHMGLTLDVDSLDDGTWASVGSDAMLRVWASSIVPSSLNDTIYDTTLTYAGVTPGLDESYRCTLGLSEDSNTLLAIMPDASMYATIETTNMTVKESAYSSYMTIRAKASRETADLIGMLQYATSSGSVSIESISESKVVTKTSAGTLWTLQSIYNLSNNGQELAIIMKTGGSQANIAIFAANNKGRSWEFDLDGDSIYVAALGEGRAVSVSTTGVASHADVEDSEVQHINLFDEPTSLIAAVAMKDGSILTYDQEGNLYRCPGLAADDKTPALIGTVPINLGAFSLVASSDNRFVAVLGTNGAWIFEMESGRLISVLNPASVNSLFGVLTDDPPGLSARVPVHDIQFSPSGTELYFIHSNGWVIKKQITTDAEAAELLKNGLPRELSDIELVAIDGGQEQ